MSKLPGPELPDLHDLGSFLREQRKNSKLSISKLSDISGFSNTYLSQIGLEVSAETLYVRAGILDEKPAAAYEGPSVLQAIAKDPVLTDRQRAVLVDVYTSFTAASAPAETAPQTTTSKEK